jgi:hypothetical protein
MTAFFSLVSGVGMNLYSALSSQVAHLFVFMRAYLCDKQVVIVVPVAGGSVIQSARLQSASLATNFTCQNFRRLVQITGSGFVVAPSLRNVVPPLVSQSIASFQLIECRQVDMVVTYSSNNLYSASNSSVVISVPQATLVQPARTAPHSLLMCLCTGRRACRRWCRRRCP